MTITAIGGVDHGVAEIGSEAATTGAILTAVPSGAISDPGGL